MKLRYVFSLCLILSLYVLASERDYQDQMTAYCASKGGLWKGDICVKEVCDDKQR